MVLFLLFFLFFFFFLQQKTRARPSLKKRANRAYRVVCRRVAIAIVFDSTRINAANRERRVTREGREKVGEIHGGSMLHVLPAGTYGLRPAVNRSNTRTWCATLRTSECARALARSPVCRLAPCLSRCFVVADFSSFKPMTASRKRVPSYGCGG